eukprot:2638451-Rhodomonas_salina.1
MPLLLLRRAQSQGIRLEDLMLNCALKAYSYSSVTLRSIPDSFLGEPRITITVSSISITRVQAHTWQFGLGENLKVGPGQAEQI